MSDDEERDEPRTSAEAAGSMIDRMRNPQDSRGQRKASGHATRSAREIEGETVTRSMAPSPEAVAPSARPKRRVGKRTPERLPRAQAAHEAEISRPVDDEGNRVVPLEEMGEEPDGAQVDPREEAFAERLVAGLFIVAMLATLGFIVSYVLISQRQNLGQQMNFALGGLLATALFAIGSGLIVWAKKLMPHDHSVGEREPFHSPEEEELLAEETFFKGVAASQIGSRKLLRRTLIGAMGLFPLPLVLLLRDLGPLPHAGLRTTGWKAGDRLVDIDTKVPVKLGDLEIGGIQTVMPEGFTTPDEYALAPTMLIRFGPGQIKSQKELNWSAENHVAYSKVCTHAGCPISLYEQQTHHLLCPCHQSTFQMDEDAKVIFGPAARPLPQLKIGVNADGYFYAVTDYAQAVGPSFWERRS